MFKKGHFFPSQPWPAENRPFHPQSRVFLLRPARRHPCVARRADTGGREHDKGPTRLREIATAGR